MSHNYKRLEKCLFLVWEKTAAQEQQSVRVICNKDTFQEEHLQRLQTWFQMMRSDLVMDQMLFPCLLYSTFPYPKAASQ